MYFILLQQYKSNGLLLTILQAVNGPHIEEIKGQQVS